MLNINKYYSDLCVKCYSKTCVCSIKVQTYVFTLRILVHVLMLFVFWCMLYTEKMSMGELLNQCIHQNTKWTGLIVGSRLNRSVNSSNYKNLTQFVKAKRHVIAPYTDTEWRSTMCQRQMSRVILVHGYLSSKM